MKKIAVVCLSIMVFIASVAEGKSTSDSRENSGVLLGKIAAALVSRELPLDKGIEFLLPKGVLQYENLESLYFRKITSVERIMVECQVLLPQAQSDKKTGGEIALIAQEINSLEKNEDESLTVRFQKLCGLEEQLLKIQKKIYQELNPAPDNQRP